MLTAGKDYICENHFLPKFVIKTYSHQIDESEVHLTRGRAKLDPKAIPSIFPNCPAYLSKEIRKRKSPAKRNFSPAKHQKQKRRKLSFQNVST